MIEFVHKAIVASYRGHSGAEEAVLKLQQSGLPMNHLSIIGRDWKANEDRAVCMVRHMMRYTAE